MNPDQKASNDAFNGLSENPLIKAVEQLLLNSQSISMTEHQIISQLVADRFIHEDYGRDPLALFQAHFLTMNALYDLQQQYRQRNQFLSVTVLNICLHKPKLDGEIQRQAAEHLANSDAPLRRYYLDWDNFKGASNRSVDKLLDSFWRRFVAQDRRHEALAVLDLAEPVTYADIKLSYRRKAMQHHPDRGGCDQRLSELNEAWELLKRYYRN